MRYLAGDYHATDGPASRRAEPPGSQVTLDDGQCYGVAIRRIGSTGEPRNGFPDRDPSRPRRMHTAWNRIALRLYQGAADRALAAAGLRRGPHDEHVARLEPVVAGAGSL